MYYKYNTKEHKQLVSGLKTDCCIDIDGRPVYLSIGNHQAQSVIRTGVVEMDIELMEPESDDDDVVLSHYPEDGQIGNQLQEMMLKFNALKLTQEHKEELAERQQNEDWLKAIKAYNRGRQLILNDWRLMKHSVREDEKSLLQQVFYVENGTKRPLNDENLSRCIDSRGHILNENITFESLPPDTLVKIIIIMLGGNVVENGRLNDNQLLEIAKTCFADAWNLSEDLYEAKLMVDLISRQIEENNNSVSSNNNSRARLRL